MLNPDKSVIPHIVEQHAEEASFLWLLRNNAVNAPHYDLDDLAKLDSRVEAHIDGLRVAGDYGWQVCNENLQIKEAGEVFAAAILALEGDSIERINHVYKVVEEVPETINGLISAFGWVEPHALQGKVSGLMASKVPIWREVGLAACAIHRVDPGEFLDQAVTDDNIQFRVRALKAVGELGRADLKNVLIQQLKHKDANVRFWAAWSAVLVGDRGEALALLRQEIEANSIFCVQAMQVALPVLDTNEVKKTLKILADNELTLRNAIIGAGISGDPVYIPWLIKHMDNPVNSRIAGESFSYLCGVDLSYQDLEQDLPQGEQAGPTENPEDENVAMDEDEDLPCPDPLLIQQWWQDNKNRFNQKERYFYGEPVDETQCKRVLKESSQRFRHAAALMLALMQPDNVLYEIRAIGKRQQDVLNAN